jgi:hypothetical protein
MLLDKIKEDFKEYTQEKCCDSGICAKFDKSVQNYVSIKIDSFFQEKHKTNTPKGIDCFVVVECKELEYQLYFIELKNQKQPNLINETPDIIKKFEDTIKYFLSSSKFKDSFRVFVEGKNYEMDFLLVSKERLDSTKKTDIPFIQKAYSKILKKVYSIELPNNKKTVILKSIKMKPHSETIIKCS